jgi:tetratricopeptide (TPR) repeat protein
MLALVGLLCGFSPTAAAATDSSAPAVRVAEESIILPTYLVGEPEPNPIFYFGRVSQGAQGRVYPYPLYDCLTSIRTNKTYQIVYLENEYVRIGILPEIGGRLFEAVDKSNGYDFIYRQHVIKPALIGLIGAWMSGGVEWNIPHHHRASTFIPVQYRLVENDDGSKTVWVGELELRHRMRWAVGYTLHPGKSYLECSVRIFNRTPFVQTMLCFANVAVHVNDQYQVIFPPGTEFVTHHHKREFTTWPIASTRYGGYDFSQGVDVSWYSNHVDANSMFAWNYADDFFAGYDHGKEAGIVSVADHQVVPGKKLWTWGNSPRGRMWDKILSDEDGPYIELMVGAYSDNQPDYSWLQPYETKSVQMFWYPFRGMGGVKKANIEAAVNLETTTNGTVLIGFCTTAAYPSAVASLTSGDQVLLQEPIAIDPARPFTKQVTFPPGTDGHSLRAALLVKGKEVVAYSPISHKLGNKEQWPVSSGDSDVKPTPVASPSAPEDIKTVEELYLTGQRLEQFHDASRAPEPYWEEALRRDPGDARVHTALGIRQLKQARFSEAETHFRKALQRLTANYTAPKDGEPLYYLGVALAAQGKHAEAFDAFFSATWSQAWRGPAYYALAEISARRSDLVRALDFLDRSLEANALNVPALGLKAALLRHTGRKEEAATVLDFAVKRTDPLDVRLLAERWLGQPETISQELRFTLRHFPLTGLETAADYGNAGLWADGTAILNLLTDAAKDPNRVSPLAYYYLGHFAEQMGHEEKAAAFRDLAVRMSPEYCFPFQWEMIQVLGRAMAANSRDARACYYLGNLLFDWQPERAVKLWEQSAELDPAFPIVHRNLAVAYSHQPNPELNKAISQLEIAVAATSKYALHFTELDEFYAQVREPPAKRLALLEQNHAVVSQRDDALSREIGLKIVAGKYDQAIQLMTGRKFSVWEGGTLEVVDHWINAHLLRGQENLQARKFDLALEDFQAAGTLPENLPSDRGGPGRHEAELAYLAGAAYDGLGQAEKAKVLWQQAANARTGRRGGPVAVGSELYFRGLAQQKLGNTDEANAAFRELVSRASDLSPGPATSQNQRSRWAGAHYAAGLGHLGLGETDQAKAEFQRALEAAPDQPETCAALRQL